MRICACIVTSGKTDLRPALDSLAAQFDEIYVVGHRLSRSAGGDRVPIMPPGHAPKGRWLVCDRPEQSYKRVMAAQATDAEVIFFMDDDARADPRVREEIERVMQDPGIGLVTGPSLLPQGATLWQRMAHLAVACNPISGPRYARHAPDFDVSSTRVIGCNMAVRRSVFEGFDPSIMPSYGEEWALAEHVRRRGYRLAYNPDQIVYHPPHPFLAQCRQVYRWGRTSRITLSAGVDPAVRGYLFVEFLFAAIWLLGRWTGRLRSPRLDRPRCR